MVRLGRMRASPLDDEFVQPIVRKAAAWSWRLLVILAAIVAITGSFAASRRGGGPGGAGADAAALLVPVVDGLDRRGAPRGGAVTLVLLAGLAVVGGLLRSSSANSSPACPVWSIKSPTASTAPATGLSTDPST